MGDRTDYDLPQRPRTAQPPPLHVPGGTSVYDLIRQDLAELDYGSQPLAVLAQREKFGLDKYGTTLQVEEPNRVATKDLVEELADAVVYARRAMAQGVPGAQFIYDGVMPMFVLASHLWA